MTLRPTAELDAKLRETAGREGRSLHETVLVADHALVDGTLRDVNDIAARIGAFLVGPLESGG